MAEPTPANEPLPRGAQMFPKLSAADIERIRPFASPRHFASGTLLCAVGEPNEGMFVVLKGTVAVSQRDGLGHVVPIVRHGQGNFLAEVGMLSGRPALVDCCADGAVEALVVPPGRLRALIIAEADLGDRIIRALRARRPR